METKYVFILNHNITDALRSLSFAMSQSLDTTHLILRFSFRHYSPQCSFWRRKGKSTPSFPLSHKCHSGPERFPGLVPLTWTALYSLQTRSQS